MANLCSFCRNVIILLITLISGAYLNDLPTEPGGTGDADLSTAYSAPEISDGLLDQQSDNNDNKPVTMETDVESSTSRVPDYIGRCPSNLACDLYGAECVDCNLGNHTDCVYGSNVKVNCTVKPGIQCTGKRTFHRSFICRYCYQTPASDHYCTDPDTDGKCRVVSAPRDRYRANCTARSHVLCLGRREFYKMKTCDWTSGKRWSTALILSITVGGFGVDRFYLGLWKEGIGKLFSFGGLGAWTLVDVVLIATGYVGPADQSLYIF